MDRIWQWAWDRYGARYSWAICAIAFLAVLPTYLLPSFLVVAFESPGHYGQAAVASVVTALATCYNAYLPFSRRRFAVVEQRAAGRDVAPTTALETTYTYARGVLARGTVGNIVGGAALVIVVAVIAGATGSRLVQWAIIGASIGMSQSLIGLRSFIEGALRPARAAIAGDTGIGDALPRSRPTFATWSNLTMITVGYVFACGGALLGGVSNRVSQFPVLCVLIGCGMTLCFVLPITFSITPSLRPIRDLTEGTERVAAGCYTRRLPVVQDDDLGALAASFNRMQAGLAERQRLHAAFGTYVDPLLTARLLEQGDDVFTGERRTVTVMFVDVRDFTPFAETNTAEDTVARLNALFDIVVPAVVDAGGHVNKFLGDGALAVFGAPNDLADHADAAVSAAVLINRLVAERFGGELRIGIGINTGVVIAGTIGGGGKLEFTLIGDTVNVAARVEQLTKTTADAILLTQQCVDALVSRSPGLIDRGLHVLKGKSAAVQVFGLDQANDAG